MIYKNVLIAFALLVISCDDESSEIYDLTGTWAIRRIDAGPINPSNTIALWIFSEGVFRTVMLADTFEGTYSSRPYVNPHEIDLYISAPSIWHPPGVANQSIYRFLNEDSLQVKIMDSAAARATDFDIEDNYDFYELSRLE